MKSGIFVMSVMSLFFPVAHADQIGTFNISVMHQDAQGLMAPFANKELSLEVAYRRGSNFEVSHTVKTNTDANGKGTLSFNTLIGFDFEYIVKFCAKLDGPHYCGSASASPPGASPVQSMYAEDDASQARYLCSSTVTTTPDYHSGTISVVCTDK